MKASVCTAYVPYTSKLEGVVPFMYIDQIGKVTTAIGNLIDPLPLALPLPFVRNDGTPATKRDIAEEWSFLKNHQELARAPSRWKAAVALPRPWGGAPLRLTQDGVDLVVQRALEHHVRRMKARFPEWDTWPADAQLLTLSVSWACGTAFRFPRYEEAVRARQWAACDEHGVPHHHIREDHPEIRPRNDAQVILGKNAQLVEDGGLDPERLYYPKLAAPESA